MKKITLNLLPTAEIKVRETIHPTLRRRTSYSFESESEDAIEVSDGYHTMEELYDHRRALTVALANFINYMGEEEVKAYKAQRHYDGTMFEGYFVVMIVRKDGTHNDQMSYHYSLEHWDEFKIPEYEIAPDQYDGHSSKEVIERLLRL
jgi:hypothetical protein